MVVELGELDLDEALRLKEYFWNLHHTDIWRVYALGEQRKWSNDPDIIKNSKLIKFTPARPVSIDKICCDVFFLPKQGVVFDLGDPYSTKALIESLDSLGYTLNDIKQVYLTHTHTDHIGMPELLKRDSERIPVFMSESEHEAYMTDPLNALEVGFRWKQIGAQYDTNAPRHGLLVRDPEEYMNQFQILTDGMRLHGVTQRSISISNLLSTDLEENEIGYYTLPNHHQAGETIYVVDKCIIIGDVLAPNVGPLGNFDKEDYQRRVKNIKGNIINKDVLRAGYAICPGHGTDYYDGKEITLSGERSEFL